MRLSDLKFADQVRLFNEADYIVGLHGAAFANLAFCKPNTKIIEIRPSTQKNNNYRKISQINNLNYRLIKTKELDKNQKKLGDIYLAVNELEYYIKSFD